MSLIRLIYKYILHAVAISLAGCIALPIPHLHPQTPEIEGHIVDDGKPVSSIEIRRIASWADQSLQDSTLTNLERRFHFAGVRSFYPLLFISLVGSPHYIYECELCFEPLELPKPIGRHLHTHPTMRLE